MTASDAGLARAGRHRAPWRPEWLLAMSVAFIVTTLPGLRRHEGYSLPLDGLLNNVAYAIAPVVCYLRSRRAATMRASWLMFSIGLGLYGLGNISWTVFIRPLSEQPFPSIADGFFLAFYPFAFAALILLIRDRAEHMPFSLWLDGLVGGLAAAAIAGAAVIEPIVNTSGGSWAAIATTTAYPLLDLLLLLIVVITLAAYNWRPPAGLWLLLAGLVLFVVADVAYLVQTAHDSYVSGRLTDGVWVLATVLMALAPGTTHRAFEFRLPSWALVTIPVVSALGAMALLGIDHARPLHPIVVGLAMATLITALVRLMVTFREVSALADSHRLALTDELTGLANRRALYEEPTPRSAPGEAELRIGLLLLDLDRFKEVNDSLGHHAGDEMLREVARRVTACVSSDHLIGRLGGDEFAVLLKRTSEAEASALAGDIRECIAAPFILDGVTLRAEASVGIALVTPDQYDMESLLRRADVAMYQAKGQHLGLSVFNGESDPGGGVDRLRTLESLRNAIARRELVLHYQPKVDAQNHEIVGVEALVRWLHPTEGLLYPDRFLPLAENAGLMAELTSCVLENALDQVVSWRAVGRDLSVAVNLSASSLVDDTLPKRVRALLEGRDLRPSFLEIEITEDFLMADRQRARDILSELRSFGVRVAVDDFGTGYSSLAYLKELPIDELKLDKSFVLEMGEDERAAAIVRSTIGLAHSLGLRLVAEGVETAEAAGELARAGCDVAQGYYFSRGLAAPDLESWLDARESEAGSSTGSPVGGRLPRPRRATDGAELRPAPVEDH